MNHAHRSADAQLDTKSLLKKVEYPVSKSLELIENRFTILILWNMLYYNHTRFNQFLNYIKEISPRTLSVRLKQMEKHGLIERKVYSETPVRIEYRPTNKGAALKSLLDVLADYSNKYCKYDEHKKDGYKLR